VNREHTTRRAAERERVEALEVRYLTVLALEYFVDTPFFGDIGSANERRSFAWRLRRWRLLGHSHGRRHNNGVRTWSRMRATRSGSSTPNHDNNDVGAGRVPPPMQATIPVPCQHDKAVSVDLPYADKCWLMLELSERTEGKLS
jgi:hypothetical protein